MTNRHGWTAATQAGRTGPTQQGRQPPSPESGCLSSIFHEFKCPLPASATTTTAVSAIAWRAQAGSPLAASSLACLWDMLLLLSSVFASAQAEAWLELLLQSRCCMGYLFRGPGAFWRYQRCSTLRHIGTHWLTVCDLPGLKLGLERSGPVPTVLIQACWSGGSSIGGHLQLRNASAAGLRQAICSSSRYH